MARNFGFRLSGSSAKGSNYRVRVCVCGCMCAGRMGSGVRPGVLTVDVISLRGLISGFMVTVFRFVGQVEGFMCESLVFSVW